MVRKQISHKPADICWDEDYTFLFFFNLEGGHRPFFLRRRFLTSFFLRSLIFFANFILIFCSSFSWSLDSRGRFSTETFSSSDSEEGTKLSGPAASASGDALAIKAPHCLGTKGARILHPSYDMGYRPKGLQHSLDTSKQEKQREKQYHHKSYLSSSIVKAQILHSNRNCTISE